MKKLSLIFLCLFLFPAYLSAQKVMVTSTVENFELTQFNCGCPSYGGDAAFAISLSKLEMTDEEVDQLIELVSNFEYENGVKVSSRTTVSDFETLKDKIKTTATGPLSGAGKDLCDFVKSLME
ncbi:MAG: hypothetical protein AAF927_17095 [Bacteroidota bacterium]